MESINNYKVEFQLNPDSTYKIGLYNYFFDNYERAKRPPVSYTHLDVYKRQTMFWYSSIGNEIFNNTKYFTDFPLFGGNRSTRMRDLSWKKGADNSKAKLPILDSKDSWGGAVPTSYYVENGSFLKLKNLIDVYKRQGQTGSPGSATMIRIRGINTVNDNGPLYVIDGVSTRNQNLSSLNPNDIESMQILKDCLLYTSRCV